MASTLKLSLAFLASIPLIHAHTRFTTLHINGQSQGDGVCIRQDRNPGTTTNFVPSITGSEMACGVDGDIVAPDTCTANAGDQLSLEHRMWPDASQPGAIDVSHKGNTAIYMKKIGGQSDPVSGDGWFKIYWDGYDTKTGEWGTDHMNSNNGFVSTTIPSDLAAGNYLIRSEVLALQELGNPQMYVGCAQVQLSGSGSAAPSDTVSIPGYIDTSTPAMAVNIYSSFTFSEYGPTAYGSGGTNGRGTSTGTSSSNNVNQNASPISASAGAKASATTGGQSGKPATTSTVSSTDNGNGSQSKPESTVYSSSAENGTVKDSDEDGIGSDKDRARAHTGSDWRSWGRWNNAKLRSRRA